MTDLGPSGPPVVRHWPLVVELTTAVGGAAVKPSSLDHFTQQEQADSSTVSRGSAVKLHLKGNPDPDQDLSDLPPIRADMSFCRFIGSEIYKDHFKLGEQAAAVT